MTEEVKIDVDALLAERQQLADEKRALGQKLAALGISGNRAYFARGSVDKAVWDQRTEWATRYASIEGRLAELKQILKTANPGHDYFKDIICESMGNEYVRRVIEECKRRRGGQPPIKVSARIPIPAVRTYKMELLKMYELAISARKALNKWISDNEPKINKADYLKSVSEINKSLPPLSVLEKELQNIKTKQK